MKENVARCIDNSLKNEISRKLNEIYGTNNAVKVTFVESYSLDANLPAETKIDALNSNHFYVYLNMNMLPFSSKEFTSAVILHEMIHCNISYNNYFGRDQQHVQMATIEYVNTVISALKELHPNMQTPNGGLDEREQHFQALGLLGFETLEPGKKYLAYYQAILNHFGLKAGKVGAIGLGHQRGVENYGKKCDN